MRRHENIAARAVLALALLVVLATYSFCAASDDFPLPPDTEGSPLPPDEALKRVTVPDGFKVTLFAHEPEIRQPIAMTFDDRGRLWVCECYSYPDFKVNNHDRVVILEDTDGDGRHDKRTIFWDKGNSLTGIEYGYGGIWVSCAPHLLFIPDKNGDDIPDGEPEIVLDGWTTEAKHNVFNGLKWGPDGWLYGCHGILATSRVGRPGTPDDKRVALNCCIWRYHPTRKTFEVVCNGTTNPWGIDFNEYGEGFFTNCVIEHAFHMIPGAHYKRMYGQDLNPYVYELMDAASDHLHWGGGHWTESRTGEQHDAPGGGHAHSGTLIYLGDSFPREYYGSLFTCNIHGHRVNNDKLERQGSGWVAKHRPDFFKANDPWFRGVALAMGPDGGMYIADWSDTGECHDYEVVHRNSGRIYKVTFGPSRPLQKRRISIKSVTPKGESRATSGQEPIDLAYSQSDSFVSEYQKARNRRLLAEMAANGKDVSEARDRFLDSVRRMRSPDLRRGPDLGKIWLTRVWGLHQIAGIQSLNDDLRGNLLHNHFSEIRGYTLRLLFDHGTPNESVIGELKKMAEDESPSVRLCLASVLQRMPIDARWGIAEKLLGHAEDETDKNIPLMLWYGIEPCVPKDPKRALELAANSKLTKPRKYIVRRLCEPDLRKDNLAAVVSTMTNSNDIDVQRSMLEGMSEAFRGLKNQPLPDGWNELTAMVAKNKDAKSKDLVRTLSLIFGDPAALKQLRATLEDVKASAADRIAAIELLSDRKVDGIVPQLIKLIDEPKLRVAALHGLSAYADDSIPKEILKRYPKWDEAERIEAINTLASRQSHARALLTAVEARQIPSQDISPFHARQLAALKNREINERLAKAWGRVKPASADKQRLKDHYKARLTDEVVQQADVRAGRAVFTRMCGACHSLFGEGAKIGPELTGAQRADLDYVLENLIDPNAIVGKNYQMTLVTLADGRVVSGVIDNESQAIVTLKTTSGTMTIPRSDIEDLTTSGVSMMPEGQLDKLSFDELRDLVAYLRSPQQVPLP